MNILLLLSHGVEEFDQLRLLSGLGHDVFSIGGYSDPAHPAEPLRPALDVPAFPDLIAACHAKRVEHEADGPMHPLDREAPVIDWAKADLPDAVIDWADVIICHHFEYQWLRLQWPRLRHKRVIWRTVGQSNPDKEAMMAPLHKDGLQIVRYSPAEQRAFAPYGAFAGQDALIRFYKDPADWYGWTGEAAVVGNITQDMAGRGPFCGLDFWLAATQGLAVSPAGPKSENLPGGIGTLTYDEMRAYLRSIRVYLYTGTQPASYTLGLIEAMMTGTPVVSIGAGRMWLPPLFEADEIVGQAADDPVLAHAALSEYLTDYADARSHGQAMRAKAIRLFGRDTIAKQWKAFLG